MRRHVIAVALLVSASSTLHAQACQGRPYFSTGKIQLGIVGEFGHNTTFIGADGSIGSDGSAFGRVTLGRESVDFTGISDPSGLAIGGTLGYQVSRGNLQICPIVSGRRSSMDLPGDIDLIRGQIQFGVSLGVNKRTNSELHIVPFAGLSFAQLSYDVSDDDSEFEASFGTDTYFPLTAGAGFHFGSSFMLLAEVTLPIDLGDSDPIFGFRFVIPVGGRR